MSPLVQLIVQELPSLVSAIQQRSAANDPTAPVPTPEQIMAELETAFGDSVAKDEMIKAALSVGS